MGRNCGTTDMLSRKNDGSVARAPGLIGLIPVGGGTEVQPGGEDWASWLLQGGRR